MDGFHGVTSTENSTMAAANENSVPVPPFLSKTYDMVDDPSSNSVVSWSDKNNSFVVWNVPDFAKNILPKYFKHSNFSSFVRQLNTYGFRKVDPDRFEFANEGFLRGQKQLLKSISRRKPAHVGSNQQPSQVHSSPVGVCVEVGKFGLEEEVERLKRDKNVLMQELVRLRQQQQTTNNQLQTIGQRVQVMELRQQQTMSFLAKAMQSPSFMTQFVKQQNESNRQITGGYKKRRLSRKEEDSLATEDLHQALDGRVVKYQPPMNEAVKALLGQVLQMNNSGRIESVMKIPDSSAVDDVSSTISLDSSSSSQVSEVTLSEFPPTSGQSFMVEESKFPVSSVHEVQSSQAVLADSVNVAELPELGLHNCPENAFSFDKFQGRKETVIGLVDPDMSFVGPDSANTGEIAMMLNGAQSLEGDAFSADSDEISKLPGINDAFWEQFLTASPLTGDTDEINSSTFGDNLAKELELASEKLDGQEKIEKILHIDHLTQQMGLLTPESS